EKDGHAVGRHRARFLVVAADETDDLLGIERRIHDQGGNAGCGRLFHGSHERKAVKRPEDDALHTRLDEASYDLDLLSMVSLAPGPLPGYLDRNGTGGQIVGRLIHAGMEGLPVPVG